MKDPAQTIKAALPVLKGLVAEEKRREMIREHMRQLGARGGKATLKKHGKGHFSKISKKGVRAKKRKA